MIRENTYSHRYYGQPISMRIRCGTHSLYVDNRELYSTYRLYDLYGRIILCHAVRTPDPVPVRPAQIIHARTIPWFMWLYYAIRDAIRQHRENRELNEWLELDQIRREAIQKAVKDRGLGRFERRYNR
jgi:hypothetical protein